MPVLVFTAMLVTMVCLIAFLYSVCTLRKQPPQPIPTACTHIGLLVAWVLLMMPLDAWCMCGVMIVLTFVVETIVVRHYGQYGFHHAVDDLAGWKQPRWGMGRSRPDAGSHPISLRNDLAATRIGKQAENPKAHL